MTGTIATQLFFDGLSIGLVYVILCLGMVLTISTSRILFLAYGVFYTLGAYATWYCIELFKLPYLVAAPVGVIASAALGAISYAVVFRPLMQREGAFLQTLIASTGLLMILSQAFILIFGTPIRAIATVIPGQISVGGASIPNEKLALMALGVAVSLFLAWVHMRTHLGRGMRAVATHPRMSSLLGININGILTLVLALGCALGGLAGAVMAPVYGLNPTMGSNTGWTVILMCMLGGFDNLLGAVVGGLIVGQLSSFGQFWLGSKTQLVLFAFIAVVLYFRPQGLMGRGTMMEMDM